MNLREFEYVQNEIDQFRKAELEIQIEKQKLEGKLTVTNPYIIDDAASEVDAEAEVN